MNARADIFVDLFNRIGCDALNIGGKDLALGINKLRSLSEKARFPFISANIVDPKTSKPIFAPYVIKGAAGFKFALTGVTPDGIYSSLSNEVQQSVKILPPADALKALIPEMKKKGANYIVVLSRLMRNEENKLLLKVPQIDFILGGQDIQRSEDVYIGDNKFIAGCSLYGKHLCVTELYFVGGKHKGFVCREGFEYTVKKINDLTLKINDKISWLNSIEKRAAQGASRVDPNSIKGMGNELERLKKEQADLVARLKNYSHPDPKKNYFKFYYVRLDGSVGEDMEVRTLINEFKSKYLKK